MIRCLFTIASVLSLLLFVAVLTVWVQSYWYWDVVEFGFPAHDSVSYGASDSNSQFLLARTFNEHGKAKPRIWSWQRYRHSAGWQSTNTTEWDRGGTRGGFTAGYVAYKPTQLHSGHGRPVSGGTFVIGVPSWFACAVCLLLPLFCLKRRFSRHTLIGICKKCGYDLRASFDRCPECGTPIALLVQAAGRGSQSDLPHATVAGE